MAATTLEIVDIDKVLKETAVKMLDTNSKKSADLDKPDINWDRMYVTHGETLYTDIRCSPTPTANVLFTANFHNATPEPKRYTLRTERRTKSICNISLIRSYTIGASVELKLIPPNPIVKANTGFHGEISMEKGVSKTFEQELAWTVECEIDVPPGKMTKADLVIKEDEFDGNFTIETKFVGEVVVTYETKKHHDHIMTIPLGVTQFLTADKGFRKDEQGRPCFISRGKCKCRFGIEQNVLLKEMDLPAEEESNKVLDEDCDLQNQ